MENSEAIILKKWSRSLYERWPFMKSFNCSDFTGKSLVFWLQVGGSLQEVVTHGGSSADEKN